MLKRLFPTVRTLAPFAVVPLGSLPGRFAEGEEKKEGEQKPDDQKSGEEKGGKPDDQKDDPNKGGDGGTGQPVPYARFSEVVGERNKAQRDLGLKDAEITRLTAQVTQLQAGDQAGTITTLQSQVKTLEKQVQDVDDYFSSLLEAEYASLPADASAMVKDIPGGPRKQFEYLAKHRARLTGAGAGAGDDKGKGGKTGPAHEKKPGEGEKAGPSGVAKGYIERNKPVATEKRTGWAAVL